jgi:pyruvate dehydrogenase E1 component alpha subunit
MAGVLGKATGPAKGKWPAHHMGDLEKGILAASLVIGSQFPIAAGAGLAIKKLGTDQVVVCFFGDGASNRGDFHEGLNLAAILSLPVVFLCENNFYAIDTPVSRSMLVKDVAVRAQGYGMPGTTIDGNDVLAVYSTVRQAVMRARGGGGPSLVECKTYRLRPHTERIKEDRPRDEIAFWMKQCPIKRFRDSLLAWGLLNEELDQEIAAESEAAVAEAVRFAEQSPYPSLGELFEDVYADGAIREGRLCAK